MKIFIFIVVSLGILFFLSSCGLLYTTKYDKEAFKFAEEYGGIYVFNKEFRDEIKKREKEREEAEEKATDEVMQRVRERKERGETKEKVTTGDTFEEKMKAIDKKYPKTLSNGCKYFAGIVSDRGDKFEPYKPYYQKIKEYMGEEAYNKLKYNILTTSYYKCGDKVIPITFLVTVFGTRTDYGMYGDEGAGISFSQDSSIQANSNNIFYLINDKFVKSNETREGAIE